MEPHKRHQNTTSKTTGVLHDTKLNNEKNNVSLGNNQTAVGKNHRHPLRSSLRKSSSSDSSVHLGSTPLFPASPSSPPATSSGTNVKTASASGSKTGGTAPNEPFHSGSSFLGEADHTKEKENPHDHLSVGHPSKTKSVPPRPLSSFSSVYSLVVSRMYSLAIVLLKLGVVLFSVLLFSFCIKAVSCFSFNFVSLASSISKAVYESGRNSTGNEAGDGKSFLGIVPWNRLVAEINCWWEEVYRCQQTY